MERNNYKECLYNNVYIPIFCIAEELPYRRVTALARYFLKKTNCSIEEAIKDAMDKCIEAKKRHIIISIINHIRENKPYTKSYIKLMCHKLNVSSKNVCYIAKRGYDPRSAIIIIYYLSDKNNNNSEKIISTKSFNKIIFDYTLYKNDLVKLKFKTAITLFCAGIISRNDVFTLLDDGFILGKARKFIRNNSMSYQLVDDLKSDITIEVLNIIDSLLPYEKEQTYKYINLRLIPLMLLLSIKYKYMDISLNGPKFPGNSGSSRTLMDYIAA